MPFDRDKSVAFTGYRPEKILRSDPDEAIFGRIGEEVGSVVTQLYNNGYRRFLTGMAEGFDMIAARAVVSLKEAGVCPDAEVAAVVPFRGQAGNYADGAKREYLDILDCAAEVHCLSEGYHPQCFHARNDFLVENAAVVVAYYDGQPGGTAYTVAKARREGRQVINICEPELFGI